LLRCSSQCTSRVNVRFELFPQQVGNVRPAEGATDTSRQAARSQASLLKDLVLLPLDIGGPIRDQQHAGSSAI
jgi:hypothetical protein